jgi:hypothetical protein
MERVMMKNNSILIGVLIVLSGCGGGGTPSSVSGTANAGSVNYQGAGSAWSLKVNSDGSCLVKETDSNLAINAACTKLSSGFTEIKVTSATGGNANLAAPAVGTVTYAYEMAGYMMPFIAFSEGKVVPTVVAGTCASSLAHNFVVSFAKTKDSISTFTGWGAVGTYQTTGDNLSGTRYDNMGVSLGNVGPFPLGLSNCSGGLLASTANGEKTSFYLTLNGGAILHQDRTNSTDPNTQGSAENDFMLPIETGISNLSQLDGNYIGFVITGNGQTGYTSKPIAVRGTTGVFNAVERSGTDLATSSASLHSRLTFNASALSPGLYKASLTHVNSGGGVGCAVSLNGGGKKIVICGGLDPADSTNKTMYSVILAAVS